MRDLRCEDQNGHFVRWLSPELASQWELEGKADRFGTGRRSKMVLRSRLTTDYFEGPVSVAALNGMERPTYRETFDNASVKPMVTLKRLSPDGNLVRWDDNLTFAEARAGMIVSEETRQQRLALKRAQHADKAMRHVNRRAA